MKALEIVKKILVFTNYTNILVSASAGMLAIGMSNAINLDHKEIYGLFVFCATMGIYNFQRLLRAKQLNKAYSEHLIWIRENQLLLTALCLLNSIIACYLFFYKLNAFEPSKYLIVFSFLISILYVVKINNRNLRDLPMLKMHWIALIWVIAIGILPLIINGDINIKSWIYSAIHYLLFIALCIPFDIRDLKFDDKNLKTIPQLIGVNKSKMLSLSLLLLFLAVSIFLQPKLIHNLLYLSNALYLMALISLSGQNRSSWYYLLLDLSLLILGVAYLF